MTNDQRLFVNLYARIIRASLQALIYRVSIEGCMVRFDHMMTRKIKAPEGRTDYGRSYQ